MCVTMRVGNNKKFANLEKKIIIGPLHIKCPANLFVSGKYHRFDIDGGAKFIMPTVLENVYVTCITGLLK